MVKPLAAPDDRQAWLRDHERSPTTTAEALAVFDALPAMPQEAMLGRWRGSGLATGHPLDGLLEAYGFYGKEFVDPETVHPLLFSDGAGGTFRVNPSRMPVDMMVNRTGGGSAIERLLFRVFRPLLQTTRPGARLRMVEHRGVVTATMVYDAIPINDVFRQVDRDTALGLMDLRGLERPFFFVLRREPPA